MRPPKPAKSRRYVTQVWSGGRWKWRARVVVAGRHATGPLRDGEDVAYRDALAMLEARERPAVGRPVVLFDACALLLARARESGIREDSARGSWRNPGRAIMRYLGAETPLASIDEDRVVRMIDRALADGLAPTTIAKGYLRVLSAALKAGGLSEDPVAAARRRKRHALRARDPLRLWYPPEELREILAAVRGWRGERDVPTRGRAADWFELIALTGVRALEFSRVLVRDVDLGRAELRIERPKDPTRPRIQPLVPSALECARRLTDGRGPDAPLLAGGISALDHACTAWSRRLGRTINARALRRSYASALDGLGAGYAVIRDGLGHAPHSTQTAKYVRAHEAALRAAVERLGDAISSDPRASEQP